MSLPQRTSLFRSVWALAWPGILSNITVPLLSLTDTTIAGHLGSAACIGAVALGGMLFNMAYWLCGFLRMGTGGLTAQQCGAGRETEAAHTLSRALVVAAMLSGVLLVCQAPLADVAFALMDAPAGTEALARRYFGIVVWGVPAVLGTYAFSGWFLGMQNARYPMWTAIGQNLLNMAASLWLVVGCGWGVEGVATGTLVAQWAGVLLCMALWQRRYGHLLHALLHAPLRERGSLGRFFRVNRDIFLRTLCLVGVTTCFTAAGATQGDLVLAANTLLMQFFVFYSYLMDGFAYAGEALGGRCCGARRRTDYVRLTRHLFKWGAALAAVFTALYALLGTQALTLLTNQAAVAQTAATYLPLAVAIPLLSTAAFLFDGLYIGATATRGMLGSMLVATAAFFGTLIVSPTHNAALWCAFLAFLALRGGMQAVLYGKVVRGIEDIL